MIEYYFEKNCVGLKSHFLLLPISVNWQVETASNGLGMKTEIEKTSDPIPWVVSFKS